MIYIFSQDYPSEGSKYAMSYVHSRSLVYLQKGLKFKVVSMTTKNSYIFEGVEVISKKDFEHKINNKFIGKSDIIISHAPNIKNHINLIRKVETKIGKVIFFFHGHEVLNINKYYPKPYKFKKSSNIEIIARNIYDYLKLKILKRKIKYLNKLQKLEIVFVSKWMFNEASLSLNMDFSNFRTHIINNNANEIFIRNNYQLDVTKKADFITVRPFDDSKYAIDKIVTLASLNPQFQFHIYGRGDYFKYNKTPNNVKVFDEFIHPRDFPILLNQYKYALMPTRLDAQGVMMCEMAVYGIPLITSDLRVCKEMLGDFSNVYLASDDFFERKINGDILQSISEKVGNKEKFSVEQTVDREIEILVRSNR